MKNKKFIGLLAIILVATLALTACDGTIPEGLDMSQFTGQGFDAALANDSSSSLDDGSSGKEHGQELKVKGEVSELTANTITINGETFTVMSNQDLTTLFSLGGIFEIEFYLNQDGTITLKDFHLEDGFDDSSSGSEHGLEIKFKGEVTEVTPDTITFNGETFTVVTGEDLTTLFTAGEFYEIEYYLNSDGTITLKEFHLEDDLSSGSDDDMDDDSDDDINDDSNDDNNDNYDDDNDYENNNNYDDSNHNDDNNNEEEDEVEND